jgi:hypothetical protein
MLILDLNNWTIKWNATIDDDSLLRKKWKLESSEYSDDFKKTGYYTIAKFSTEQVTNTIYDLLPDEDF